MHAMRTGTLASFVVLLLAGPLDTHGDEPEERSARGVEGQRPGELREDNGLDMELVWCPPGSFAMGSPKSEVGRYPEENQVRVTLSAGFWLGKTEVTRSQWTRLMQTEPWKNDPKQDPNYPVTSVDYEGAVKFCSRLTDQEQKAGRLPPGSEYRLTWEAEWEYACRAGSRGRYSFGDDDGQLSDYAWWGGNLNASGNHPQLVAQKRANAWGLHDMLGNVHEWCGGAFSAKLKGGTDPWAKPRGSNRVIRGGAFNSSRARDCRSARRAVSSAPGGTIGFRVALSSKKPAKAHGSPQPLPTHKRAVLGPGDKRIEWVYKDQNNGKNSGWFKRNDDGTWTENTGNGECLFEERERNADYVLLFDRKRKMYLRCYDEHVDILNSSDGEWLKLYDGSWAKH